MSKFDWTVVHEIVIPGNRGQRPNKDELCYSRNVTGGMMFDSPEQIAQLLQLPDSGTWCSLNLFRCEANRLRIYSTSHNSLRTMTGVFRGRDTKFGPVKITKSIYIMHSAIRAHVSYDPNDARLVIPVRQPNAFKNVA